MSIALIAWRLLQAYDRWTAFSITTPRWGRKLVSYLALFFDSTSEQRQTRGKSAGSATTLAIVSFAPSAALILNTIGSYLPCSSLCFFSLVFLSELHLTHVCFVKEDRIQSKTIVAASNNFEPAESVCFLQWRLFIASAYQKISRQISRHGNWQRNVLNPSSVQWLSLPSSWTCSMMQHPHLLHSFLLFNRLNCGPCDGIRSSLCRLKVYTVCYLSRFRSRTLPR